MTQKSNQIIVTLTCIHAPKKWNWSVKWFLNYRDNKNGTDGRTDGQLENVMPSATLWRRHKKKINLAKSALKLLCSIIANCSLILFQAVFPLSLLTGIILIPCFPNICIDRFLINMQFIHTEIWSSNKKKHPNPSPNLLLIQISITKYLYLCISCPWR